MAMRMITYWRLSDEPGAEAIADTELSARLVASGFRKDESMVLTELRTTPIGGYVTTGISAWVRTN